MARKAKEWQRYMQIDRGLELIGMDRYDLADRLTLETGEDWTYRMVHNLCNGKKTLTDEILVALHRITGLPYGWFLDDPRDVLDLRDLNAGKPLHLNSRQGYEPTEDLHPVNIGVSDADWFHRDDTMYLPNPDYWTRPLQSETLPLKVSA